MKVLIIGNWAADRQHSMLGFASGLAEIMRDRGHEVIVDAPSPGLAYRLARPWAGEKWGAYAEKFIAYRARLNRLAARHDLVHIADHSNAMYGPMLDSAPWLVTLHDLLPSRAALDELDYWKVGWTGKRLQAWIRKSLKAAPLIHSISEATTVDAHRLCPPINGRIVTIPNCLYQRPELPQRRRQGPVQWLHIGGDQPYKNKAGVVGVFSSLIRLPEFHDSRLVMAGRPPSQELMDDIERCDLSSRIDIRTQVSDSDLAQLWADSDGLLFLSRHEGFGLPILEAQHAGILAVTTDRAPMNDVLGAGGVAVDPDSPDEAARIIADAWSRKSELIEAGKHNLERFRKVDMAERMEHLWQEAARGA